MGRAAVVVWLASGAMLLGGCADGAAPPPSGDAGAPTEVMGFPAPDANALVKSAGCGKALADAAASGTQSFTVTPTGATLSGAVKSVAPSTFAVRIPSDYDPNVAYPVVYFAQPCGGGPGSDFDLAARGFNGNDEVLYVDVPADTTTTSGPAGTPALACYDLSDATTSDELEAFSLFHTVVEQTFCVDENRVFVGGSEAGATLANLWGCYFAGDGQRPASDPSTPRRFSPAVHVRAQVSVLGDAPPNQPACNGPVAALMFQNSVALGGNDPDRQRVLAMNGCSSVNERWHPLDDAIGTCWQYACSPDYPVVLCDIDSFEGADTRFQAITAFTIFLNEVEPLP